MTGALALRAIRHSSAARARGLGDQDMAALIRLLEEIAGVEVRRADA